MSKYPTRYVFYRHKNETNLLHFYSIQKRYQNSEDIIRCFSLDVDAVDLNDLVATWYQTYKTKKQF
jgi:hypothetical protein